MTETEADPVTLEQPMPPPRGRVRVTLGMVAVVASLPLLALAWVVIADATAALVLFQKARSWVPVEVTIEDVQLVERSTVFGPRRQVHARYTWEAQGVKHFGQRVGVEGESDDPFQLERHEILVEHRDRHLPFVAMVDPAAPTQSLLFVHPTERLFIAPLQGTALTMLGGLLLGLGVRLLRRRPRPKS